MISLPCKKCLVFPMCKLSITECEELIYPIDHIKILRRKCKILDNYIISGKDINGVHIIDPSKQEDEEDSSTFIKTDIILLVSRKYQAYELFFPDESQQKELK